MNQKQLLSAILVISTLCVLASTQNLVVFESLNEFAQRAHPRQIKDKIKLPEFPEIKTEKLTIRNIKGSEVKLTNEDIGSSVFPESKKLLHFGGEYTIKLTFSYESKEGLITKKGDGSALLKTKVIQSDHVLSVLDGSVKQEVSTKVEILRELYDFQTTGKIGDGSKENIKNKLREQLEIYTQLEQILSITLQEHVQGVVDTHHKTHQKSQEYTYPGQTPISLDQQVQSIEVVNNGVISILRGAIQQQTPEISTVTHTFDPQLGSTQVIYQGQFIKDLHTYANGLKQFEKTYRKGDVSIKGVDFIAGDLFYLLPELRAKYYSDEPLSIQCKTQDKNTFSFDVENQKIIQKSEIGCFVQIQEDTVLTITGTYQTTIHVTIQANSFVVLASDTLLIDSPVITPELSNIGTDIVINIQQEFIKTITTRHTWGNNLNVYKVASPKLEIYDGYLLIY